VTTTTEASGARIIAELIHGHGVSHVFFVPAILREGLGELAALGVRSISTHGEKAAAYMADGYARSLGRPGICLAQTVGAANIAAGLKDAYLSCSPVIAITGGTHPETRYRQVYQGWGFPAAIGAKCALGDRPVVCFTGDGGFYYHLAELETAARYDVPVVVVVNNNGSYGAERRGGPNPYRSDESAEADRSWKFSGQHDFAQIARELGCQGIRIEDPGAVGSAVQESLASGKPTVVDVLTDPTAAHPRAWTSPANAR
jgi:thiamine pyrophosphate-dependent acetolactate synthase large subunit-like protein